MFFRLAAAKLGSTTAEAALSVSENNWQDISVEPEKHRGGNIITIGDRRFVQSKFYGFFDDASKAKKSEWGELKSGNEVHQVWPVSESALSYINSASVN